MDLKAYAEQAGKSRTSLNHNVHAWRVLSATHMGHESPPWYLYGYDEPVPFPALEEEPRPNAWLKEHWRNLAEIHAAPEWLWTALVHQMVADHWTVAATREKVKAVKDIAEPPIWADSEQIAELLMEGTGGVTRSTRAARQPRARVPGSRFLGIATRVIPRFTL